MLRPIPVFVFHQVGKQFDESNMWECDWNDISSFQQRILKLKSEYQFITLSEAYEYIAHDRVRTKKYAVLTADDGYTSLHNILPWLAENKIPVTLFLNPAYLMEREVPGKGTALLENELNTLVLQCQPYITIASHGWTHAMCTSMSDKEFEHSVNRSIDYLQMRKEYVPFFAYPCGKHTSAQDEYLLSRNLIPVYCDGMKNYKDSHMIHRECIDEGFRK